MNKEQLLKELNKAIANEIDKINNSIIPKIKAKIQELFPKMDMDFLLNSSKSYFETKFEELNYNQFISYKLKLHFIFNKYEQMLIKVPARKRTSFAFIGTDADIIQKGVDGVNGEYYKFLDILNKINPNIFMSNVNLDWKILQLAKNDKSILIPPPSAPSPPPLPLSVVKTSLFSSRSKRNSPKSRTKITDETLQKAKSKLKPKPPPPPKQRPSSKTNVSISRGSPLTSKKLEEAKSKLKHSQIKINPDNQDYDIEMAFRNLKK